MSSPTIYLHIGMNKTGTTAIQHYFSSNRESFLDKGLLYPKTGMSRDGAHHDLSRSLGFYHGAKDVSVDDIKAQQKIMKGLLSELQQSTANTVIFSSEMLVLPRPVDKVKEFFSKYNVKIVVYLRRHDSWWESLYNQAVKTVALPPWGRGFNSYLRYQYTKNKQLGNYRLLLERWAKVFGQENIIVRPYEKQQNKPNLVTDLLESIGFGDLGNDIITSPKRANESLSFQSLSLMEIYQNSDVSEDVRSRLVRHAQSLVIDEPRASILSPEMRRKLVDNNDKQYQFIARKYLGRKNGKLFLDPLPEPDDVWERPRQPTPVFIVEETVKALS